MSKSKEPVIFADQIADPNGRIDWCADNVMPFVAALALVAIAALIAAAC